VTWYGKIRVSARCWLTVPPSCSRGRPLAKERYLCISAIHTYMPTINALKKAPIQPASRRCISIPYSNGTTAWQTSRAYHDEVRYEEEEEEDSEGRWTNSTRRACGCTLSILLTPVVALGERGVSRQRFRGHFQ